MVKNGVFGKRDEKFVAPKMEKNVVSKRGRALKNPVNLGEFATEEEIDEAVKQKAALKAHMTFKLLCELYSSVSLWLCHVLFLTYFRRITCL